MFLSATDFRKATLRIGKVFTYKNAVYFKITFSEDFLRIFKNAFGLISKIGNRRKNCYKTGPDPDVEL